ncbi:MULTISPECIES: hypothetical protein [unclassified Lysobacter]|uniref:hypothetical protein n=1 Tax=unclassified Lysobacter TaxID=2635362 RepID=UPI001BE55F5E|nr:MULTISPECIES: hypothetical protein [unclassified Lysobacter]MBT2745968.1 hypothetical protein [Lysobacter sp. ISL-42]MBT2752649.1 hypothetical protein [Lysobacter sp. ISL-50]MBT2777388.1 hypothetical protein [Lysobacter sp. ISL-54]MBT2783579.1 hypothetical protein [Lysobacter sp. ISL-52]
MSTDTRSTQNAQLRRAMQALHAATWFALCEGDRYTAQGRKAVANSFYNLLPMLADVRKAIIAEPEPEPEPAEAAAQPPAANPRAAGMLHLVTAPASETPAPE